MKDILVYLVIGCLFLGLFLALSSIGETQCKAKGGQFIQIGARFGCITK